MDPGGSHRIVIDFQSSVGMFAMPSGLVAVCIPVVVVIIAGQIIPT